ncbi:ribbon-helix-helix domain-containing protein [Thermus sp.]|uniref:ribbon-helix-helix domain-containing protein n=1 Tax=Thermus sp. TaxID=275 RepID=UPI00391CE64B
MVRTQVRLTGEQAQRLKVLAQEERASLAKLVRRAVEGYLQEKGNGGFAQRAERALAVVGRFTSGLRDMSQEHDRYLMGEDRLGRLP